MNKKLEHMRWVLPNAPDNRDAQGQAWYVPKAFSSPMKPRVPGQEDNDLNEDDDDDEGIFWSVDYVDTLIRKEVEKGTPKDRIVVGGFSQGCAISSVWALTGAEREGVAGVVGLSGYLPCSSKIKEKRNGELLKAEERKKFFLIHGTRDILVPKKLFFHMRDTALHYVGEANKDDVEEHMYEGLGHSTNGQEIRDLYNWLNMVVPP